MAIRFIFFRLGLLLFKEQLRHETADARLLLDQVHQVALVREEADYYLWSEIAERARQADRTAVAAVFASLKAERYGDRGLVVVGFPSPDFGGQEFDTAEEIRGFCTLNFGVTFPLSERVHVRGGDAIPLFAELTRDTPEGIRGDIKWNFTKFLVNGDGEVVARFEPAVDPMDEAIVSAVQELLPADS